MAANLGRIMDPLLVNKRYGGEAQYNQLVEDGAFDRTYRMPVRSRIDSIAHSLGYQAGIDILIGLSTDLSRINTVLTGAALGIVISTILEPRANIPR